MELNQEDFLEIWGRIFTSEYGFSLQGMYTEPRVRKRFFLFNSDAVRHMIPEEARSLLIADVVNDYYDCGHRDAASYLANCAVETYGALPKPPFITNPPCGC